MARITCGANDTSGDRFDGKTIEQVRNELKAVLNIPENATILLNGNETTSTNVALRHDDELEFVKPGGEKGTPKA